MTHPALVWWVLFTAVVTVSVASQEDSPESYLKEARSAIAEQRYDHAVRVLEEGQALFPETTEFNMFLGDLYYDRELYELALIEYQQAEAIDGESYTIREALAFTHGRLSNDLASLEYWRSMTDDFPERPGPVQNLGWLYFKVHRLEEGERLVLDGLERFGPDPDLTMTLATLYADMYRFSDSQMHYRRAIELASSTGDDNFVAVAYYNLSLIQKAFYHFTDSLESTNASLAHARRATGYLARGELFELRLDYDRAASDYTTAYNLDDRTPLARMNLAVLNQRFGHLDEALSYARSVHEDSDLSWMYNFGTDTNRHSMDTHEILADCYRALWNTARLTVSAGIGEWFVRLWTRLRLRVQEWYHRSTYRRLSGRVAQAYLEQGSHIDGTWTFFQAVEPYRPVARGYLLEAANLEVSVIPEASLAYEVEIGRLNSDLPRLEATLPQLLDPWDAHLRELALRSVAELTRRRSTDILTKDLYTTATAALYKLNPGGLRQYGLKLPVRLDLSEVSDTRITRLLRRFLSASGFEPTRNGNAPVLTLSFVDETIIARLGSGSDERETHAILAGATRREIAHGVTSLADDLFRTP